MMRSLPRFFLIAGLAGFQSLPGSAEICQELMQRDRAQAANQNLARMKDLALNSTDFKERAASASAVLAAFKIPESPQGLAQARELTGSPSSWCRWWGYVLIAYLDLAQVRDARSRADVVKGLKDREPDVRKSAVNAIGTMADADLVAHMKNTFTSDSDLSVRERAACSMSHTGLYTKGQRRAFVPFFIGVMKDPKMDEQTKNWSVQALNYITGLNYGRDVRQWENWANLK